MKQLAIAIMVVGLCFYSAYLRINHQEVDSSAEIISTIGAIWLLLS